MAYKSGVKKHITPHSARHSFAFFMLDRHNTPLYTLSKILGHTNARTTEDEYGHLSAENIEEAMEKGIWGVESFHSSQLCRVLEVCFVLCSLLYTNHFPTAKTKHYEKIISSILSTILSVIAVMQA